MPVLRVFPSSETPHMCITSDQSEGKVFVVGMPVIRAMLEGVE